ncbi:hypothetical protein Droror1_Dr00026929, partial [Drosera rotundifolia]
MLAEGVEVLEFICFTCYVVAISRFFKSKKKKVNVDDVEFHKQDEVKCGEVVQARPKLVVPK